MNKASLIEQIKIKESFLCVGLDPDVNKLPLHLKNDPDGIVKFCKEIIDATKDYAVAYKPNLAFFEVLGARGWQMLEEVVSYIPESIFTIADAKRGDIGNTSKMYAQTFFDTYNFDSVTVAPYMGEDSVTPFLEFENKWVILLAATSNKGGDDFQYQEMTNGKLLFQEVLEASKKWGNDEYLMYVVGATRPEVFQQVRKIVPTSFLLVPGVGAQGGSLKEVVQNGMNKDCGLLVNSSRGIIYASSGEDFASRAAEKARELQQEMKIYLKEYELI